MPLRPIDMERILIAHGWTLKAQNGSHRHYIHPTRPRKVTIPSPSPIEEINMIAIAKELEIQFYKAESFVNMVSVDVLEYAKTHFEKSVKKTLTIPMWLNKLALEQNVNFSQVLQNALMDILELSPNTKKHTTKGV